MATKKLIAEQVLFRLYGGYPDSAAPVQEPDVYKALEQKLNSTFKIRHFDSTLPSGETMPENSMIATYENNTVTRTDDGKSYSLLPIQPISLPKNMGIYLVYDPAHPDMPFIPLQRGQSFLINSDELLNDLNGQIGYEPKNDRLIFRKDLTTYGITAVTMELCVFDISQYSTTERLPIPSDYEEALVNELIKDFAPVQPENGLVDNFSVSGQNSGKQ